MSVVLFLTGASMGDALASSGRGLRPIFEELGHEFVEINFTRPDAHSLLSSTVSTKPIEFAFSHVGGAVDLSAETNDKRKVNFWMASRIPFISFFGDSPAYFFDRHVMPGPGFASLYAFPEHYRYRKILPQCTGVLGVTPLRISDETPKNDIDFRAKESGKLFFLKNGNDPDQLIKMWREALPLNTFLMLTELAGDLAGQMQADKGCNIDAVVCKYFIDKGIDIDALVTLRLFFVAQLDDYLRRMKSTWMAEVLSNFDVEIHGFNWEHVDFAGKRAKYVSGADYTASRALIANSLGILDMSPNTSLGPHDRPLRAFGLHTLCLTNEQQFFKDHFEQHRDFTFRFEKDSLETKVADVLAHPKRFVEFGAHVAETFRSQCDQELFGRTMLDISSALRLAAGPRPAELQNFFAWPPTKLG